MNNSAIRFGTAMLLVAGMLFFITAAAGAAVDVDETGDRIVIENAEKGVKLAVNKDSGLFRVYRHGEEWLGHGLVAVRPGGKMLLNAARDGKPSGDMELIDSRAGEGAGQSGSYKSAVLEWNAGGMVFTTEFRVYDEYPMIGFVQTFPDGYDAGTDAEFTDTSLNFPVFSATGDVQELNLFTYWYRIWPSPRFGKNVRKTFRDWGDGYNCTPLMIMNEEGGTALLSPMNDFLIRIVRVMDLAGRGFSPSVAVGLNGELARLDPGHETRSMLFFDDGGPNSALEAYGAALLREYEKEPLAPDSYYFLKYIGYWTDNGAYYYYRTEEDKNYETTLLDMREYLKEENIPLKYFQMDSWWYPKSDKDNGVMVWEPKEEMFPDGFAAFQRKLGLPLTFHNRYFAVDTPYQERFEFVKDYRNPGPGEGAKGAKGDLKGVHPVTDEIFELWADQVEPWGGVMYEQDWLGTQVDRVGQLRSDPDLADKWMTDMAVAMDAKDFDIQYCMPTMGFYLESVKFQNVSNIRSANDYKIRLGGRSNQLWWEHIYTSGIISALGVYPFKDVIITNPPEKIEKNPVLRNLQGSTGDRYEEGITLSEPFYHHSALMSVLSAGPVGIGDRINDVNKEIVMLMADGDGVIVKPDKPLVPIDRMYYTSAITNDIALTGYTHSEVSDAAWYYVLGVNATEAMGNADFNITRKDIGAEGDYVAYDFIRKRAMALDGDFNIRQRLEPLGFIYIVMAPMTQTGRALIGDIGKYVTASNNRIASWNDSAGAMEIELAGPAGSPAQLLIYAEEAPSAVKSVSRGTPVPQAEDPESIGEGNEGWTQPTRNLLLIGVRGGDGEKVRVEF